MNDSIGKLLARARDWIWSDSLQSLSGRRRLWIHSLRLMYATGRDLWDGQLTLRAMSLVYTTLLSLVPALAVSFSVLKAFGVHNQVEPLLVNVLQACGSQAPNIARNVIDFVENVRVGVLSSIGVALLIYTVVSLMQKIESAFNFVWRIESLREFGHRLSGYLSVALIGPVLVFTAMGLTASVMSAAWVQRVVAIEPFGTLMLGASRLIPYVLVWVAFTFIYVFVPNTRVRMGPALIAGLAAAVLWQTTGWTFATFIATSTRYTALYSSFAIAVLLLIWLYLNWLILLLGAQIAFYLQNPRQLAASPARPVLSNRLKERLALGIMYLIARSHHRGRPPWTLHRLAEELDLPPGPVHELLLMMRGEGFIERTADEPPAFLPARDVETIRVRDLLVAVRRADESQQLRYERIPSLGPVDDLLHQERRAAADTLEDTTLRDLVRRGAENVTDHPARGKLG